MANDWTSSRANATSLANPRRRWREQEGRRVLRSWRRSGLSARAFAESIGVDAQRLLWWRKRLEATDGDAGTPAPQSPTFIPATLVPTTSAVAVTVRLAGGVSIEVADPAAAPAAWIAAVVAALGKVAT